jgi:hypothetical protein
MRPKNRPSGKFGVRNLFILINSLQVGADSAADTEPGLRTGL